MQYQQDWVMRQIEIIISILRGLIAGRSANKNKFDEFARSTALDESLRTKLSEKIAEHRIGEAEDLLFDAIETSKEPLTEDAFWFYEKINALSDETLNAGDFSRAEILSGLREICGHYHLPDAVFFEILDKQRPGR